MFKLSKPVFYPKQSGNSILKPQGPYGYYVAYVDGEVKYSRKPIYKECPRDYGSMIKLDQQLTTARLHRPLTDALVEDTRSLFQ